MSNEEQAVRVQDEEGVRTITLNRPDKLNAFNEAMLIGLGKAVKGAARDKSVRCVVITGAGRAFGAGQDLDEVSHRYKSDEPIELGTHLRKHYNPIVRTIRTMEKPVIGAINGVMAGAGASIALACDFRIASDAASYASAFIHVGLIPDAGGSFMLPRLVGFGRALEIAMTGRKIRADEALQIGLFNQVVPAAEFPDAVKSLASRLAKMPTKAIGLTKRAINHSWGAALDEQLDYESMLQTTGGQSRDHREGIVAFLDKRKPEFVGE